ncbi:magnesium transporter, partial [Haematococcus lacustris]
MSDFASVNGLEQSSGRAAPSAQTAQLTGRLHKHKNRKKEEKPSALLRTWVCIHPSGESSVVQVDKLSLSAQLGIQPRDLRLLESQLAGQTSVILCREGAIVINMAFVK